MLNDHTVVLHFVDSEAEEMIYQQHLLLGVEAEDCVNTNNDEVDTQHQLNLVSAAETEDCVDTDNDEVRMQHQQNLVSAAEAENCEDTSNQAGETLHQQSMMPIAEAHDMKSHGSTDGANPLIYLDRCSICKDYGTVFEPLVTGQYTLG